MSKRKITENTGTVQQISNNIDLGEYYKDTVTTTTASYDWCIPVLLETIITEKGVEQIFRQDSTITYTVFYGTGSSPSPRIYKNVYRIVKGKLKLTETIEGKYIPQKEESYEF